MPKEIINRKLPKMIIFDYGHTLLYESGLDAVRGYEALLAYATRNENNLNAFEIASVSNDFFSEINRCSRDHGVEIHNHMLLRLLFEYLELEFSLSLDELGTLFWDQAIPGEPMPNVDKMISFLNDRGIRSAVISNISFSESTLTNRINRLIPNNKFEFIMASSEYIFRKPNKILFEIALKRAHLNPEEVWFCGDHPLFDVMGASSAGLLPVWYQSPLECPYRKDAQDDEPECEHLHIHDWIELIEILQNLN